MNSRDQQALWHLLAILSILSPLTVQAQQANWNRDGLGQYGPRINFDVPRGLETPKRYQLDNADQTGSRCGPNALFLLLRLCGRKVEYEEVISQVPLDENGSTLDDLHIAATHFGFATTVRGKVPPVALSSRVLPAIVHIESKAGVQGDASDHFLVITSERNGESFSGIDATDLTTTTYTAQSLGQNMSGYVLFPVNGHSGYGINTAVFRGALVLLVCLVAVNGWCYFRER